MICNKIQGESNAGIPEKRILEFYKNVFYGELSFMANEYYFAKQSSSQIVKKIRIHEDKTISNANVIIIDGVNYDAGRCYTTEVKGVAVTEITLERTTTDYDTSKLV